MVKSVNPICCVVETINTLYGDDMSPKFEKIGGTKHCDLINSVSLPNGVYFWLEVTEML